MEPTREVSIETFPGGRDDVLIIRVHGPLTIHNFFEFQSLTRKQPAPRVLLIDLADVPYIDSAVLGSLVGLHVSRGNAGRKYALINANERLEKMFAMTAVSTFLVRYPSIKAAEQAFA